MPGSGFIMQQFEESRKREEEKEQKKKIVELENRLAELEAELEEIKAQDNITDEDLKQAFIDYVKEVLK